MTTLCQQGFKKVKIISLSSNVLPLKLLSAYHTITCMKIRRFLLKHFISGDEVFHLARVKIYSKQDLSLHDHDYAEMFWVENGSGTHLINGEKISLKPGQLVMMRPQDQHTFTASRQGITIMNLAFPKQTLAHLRKRYFPSNDTYFWATTPLPYQVSLELPDIKNISVHAEQMWKYQHSHLHLDSFLLRIFKQLEPEDGKLEHKDAPVWLTSAINDFFTDELFRQGASGFALRCGKHIDYVNRMVRKHYNKTLSELVTELRMSFAARQLSITNVPIKSICVDCGFNNLGHFYKMFQHVYHQTPSNYRKQHQTIV